MPRAPIRAYLQNSLKSDGPRCHARAERREAMTALAAGELQRAFCRAIPPPKNLQARAQMPARFG